MILFPSLCKLSLSERQMDWQAWNIYAQMHARTLNRLKQGHAEGQAVRKRSHSVK